MLKLFVVQLGNFYRCFVLSWNILILVFVNLGKIFSKLGLPVVINLLLALFLLLLALYTSASLEPIRAVGSLTFFDLPN